MKVGVYYRVSSDLQDHSLTMQEHMGLEASIKHDVVIERVFDEGVCSARKVPMHERPQLNLLRDAIKTGEITHLIVYKRDRLARKSTEYMQIYQELKDHQVQVIFSADNEFPIRYDAVGEYIELIMSGLIEREGDLITKRIRDTKIANFLNGTSVGPLPYGYELLEEKGSKERIVPNKDKLAIVRELFDLVLAGHPLNDIRKMFNAKGYTRTYEADTKYHKKGELREWKVADFNHILQSTLYYGVASMTFTGMDDPITYPRPEAKIIEKVEWLRIQERLRALNPEPDDEDLEAKEPIVFHAEGIFYCRLCNEVMISKIRRPERTATGYYECKNHPKIRVEAKAVETLLLEHAEHAFRELLETNFEDLAKRHMEKTEKEWLERRKKREDIQNAIRNEMVKSAGLFLKSSEESVRKKRIRKMIEFHDEMQELHEECLRIQARLKSLQELLEAPRVYHSQIKQRLSDVVRNSEDLSYLLKNIIARVDVDREGLDITIQHPFLKILEVGLDVTA